MPVSRLFPIALILGLLAGPASTVTVLAADQPQRACLSKAEQRAAVATHRAIPLARAINSMRKRGQRAEVVQAQLCRRDSSLVYVLTLLARNGKVTRVTVDAANGELINGH